MAKKDERYPRYQIHSRKELIAIIGSAEMYLIRQEGTNSGCEGVSIDHYITRKKVITYYGGGREISKEQFIFMYDSLFAAYRQKITL